MVDRIPPRKKYFLVRIIYQERGNMLDAHVFQEAGNLVHRLKCYRYLFLFNLLDDLVALPAVLAIK